MQPRDNSSPQEEPQRREIRLPVAVPTTSRKATELDKDSLLQNVFIDTSKLGSKYAVKRPGFLVGSEAVTTALRTPGNPDPMRGIFVNPNNTTGGVAGETEIWYISSMYTTTPSLSSFSHPLPPPGFRDFSFNYTQELLNNNTTQARENSISDLIFTVEVGDSAFPGDQVRVLIGRYLDLGFYVDSGRTFWPIIAGISLVEVKLESDKFNLYRNGALWVSLSAIGIPEFSIPTLILNQTGEALTNLQFL